MMPSANCWKRTFGHPRPARSPPASPTTARTPSRDLNGSNQLQMWRLYLDGVDQLFARISSTGTAAWYLSDRVGSVRDIVDGTGSTRTISTTTASATAPKP